MIDIHTHVLYGLDDGARTLEESVAMLRMAAETGTTDVVATPHANLRYAFEPQRIRERAEEVSLAAGGAPHIYTGSDFHLSYDNIEDALKNPTKYTINQKNYLLVEFSDFLIFKNTADIFGRLADAGMTPVVTHPERNQLLQQRLEEIGSWVDQGTLVQVTALSLLGGFGRRARDFCAALMERGLVHFVASDAHDCERRPPRLDEAYRWIEGRYGPALAEALLVKNPRAALVGEPLDGEPGGIAPKPRKWYQFWD